MEIFSREVKITAKSCILATRSMNLVCNSIKDRITERKEIICELMSRELYTALKSQYEINKNFVDNDLPGGLEFCYMPKIEGGDNYKLSLNKLEKNKNIGFDVFHCALGLVYKNQRSNYIRTMLIYPTVNVKKNYNFMLLIEHEVLKNLRAGVELCKVFDAAISLAVNISVEKAQHLKKDFGFLIAPYIEGKSVIINSETKVIVQENMIFAVTIELAGLVDEERQYTLINGDTVLVRKDNPALILTHHQKKFQKFVMEENKEMNVEETENSIIQMLQDNLETLHL